MPEKKTSTGREQMRKRWNRKTVELDGRVWKKVEEGKEGGNGMEGAGTELGREERDLHVSGQRGNKNKKGRKEGRKCALFFGFLLPPAAVIIVRH